MRSIVFAMVCVSATASGDAPKPACPTAVKTAIDKAFQKATIATCKRERENGHDQFEVKIARADGSKAEVDVSEDGKILQVEENIVLADVPAAVMKAFASRYPKAKASSAERQTPTTGSASYELAFSINGVRKEATFTKDGGFVEEE